VFELYKKAAEKNIEIPDPFTEMQKQKTPISDRLEAFALRRTRDGEISSKDLEDFGKMKTQTKINMDTYFRGEEGFPKEPKATWPLPTRRLHELETASRDQSSQRWLGRMFGRAIPVKPAGDSEVEVKPAAPVSRWKEGWGKTPGLFFPEGAATHHKKQGGLWTWW
jgi:hypothetical protein